MRTFSLRFTLIFYLFAAMLFTFLLMAQNQIRVIDFLSKEVISSAQIIQNSKLIGKTDNFGVFFTDTCNGKIEISKQNFLTEVVNIDPKMGEMNVYLHKEKPGEIVNLMYEEKPDKYITSSLSVISGSELQNIPGSNRLNSLSGRVAGLGILQFSGLPDNEDSSIKIRGQHTFGNHPGTAILIDGHQSDVRMLDPYDIESVTVLKDAPAKVLYGLNATNGVILITTKKGTEGKLNIKYNGGLSIQEPIRIPQFLNSYQYAVLYNEALLNDNPNQAPLYSLHDIEGYKTGHTPHWYPNVEWSELFLKNQTYQSRHNINLSGNSGIARYYVSMGYLYNSGIFNVDKELNSYNTNTSLSVFNIHGNLELLINKNFTVKVDIKAKKDKRNFPGSFNSGYDRNILTTLYSTPNNAFQPITYNGDQLGGWYNGVNPYGLLNYSGYSIFETNFISTNIDIVYDLNNLINGLSLFGFFGLNSANDYVTNRTKTFATYIYHPNSFVWNKRGEDTPISSSGAYQSINRNYDHQLGIKYDRDLELHHIDVSVMIQRQQLKEHLYSSIGQIYQGGKGRLSYRYNNKYLLDFASSYEGSNYFPKSNRYGLFTALSAGWLISEEDLFKDNKNINLLKIRGSVGETGNSIGTAWATYYGYISNFSVGSGAYFGSTPIETTGMYQSRVANNRLTWEKAQQANLGIDFSFFESRLSGKMDLFVEKNRDILIANATSVMYGAEIWVPEGRMSNKGFEVDLGWNDKINEFNYFVKLNYSFARNSIDYKNEEFRQYTWRYETGRPYGTRFGYVFDRFFTEEDDFSQLPNQSLLGNVQPGDLKFKDLNNDNIIDENDIADIGKQKFPEIFYGLNLGFATKGIDFNVLLQGVANSSTYNSGYTYWAFHGRTGNVTAAALNRWTPGSGQNAEYPRLSLTNTNNTQTSSFWVSNSSFLRLKNLELGYTLPSSYTRILSVSSIRFYVVGTNLYSWDSVKYKDPEGVDDALSYPNVRSVGCGINISF